MMATYGTPTNAKNKANYVPDLEDIYLHRTGAKGG